MNGEQRPRWYFVHAWADQNLFILIMFEGIYLLDASQIINTHTCNYFCNMTWCFVLCLVDIQRSQDHTR